VIVGILILTGVVRYFAVLWWSSTVCIVVDFKLENPRGHPAAHMKEETLRERLRST